MFWKSFVVVALSFIMLLSFMQTSVRYAVEDRGSGRITWDQ